MVRPRLGIGLGFGLGLGRALGSGVAAHSVSGKVHINKLVLLKSPYYIHTRHVARSLSDSRL